MNKIIILLGSLLLLCNSIFAYRRDIHPMTVNPDFSATGGLVGWYDNILSISYTTTNPGFSIQVDFSTPAIPLNETILTFGGKWGTSLDNAILIKENNATLKFSRHVKYNDSYGFYESNAWNPNILKRNTNYSLKVEIDETRLRYSIWEEGKPDSISYEYEFYGMASSYLKDILARTTKNLAYAVNLHYFPQKLKIEDLGSGVGVDPVKPAPTIRWGHLVNLNSNMYLRRQGTTSLGNLMYQNTNSDSANDLWELRPTNDSKRTPLSYSATFQNLYSDMYLSPQGCRKGNDVPLYETSFTDCNDWQIKKTVKEAIYFNLLNNSTNSYATVKNKSKEAMAPIVTSEQITGTECSWNFVDLNFDAPIETGYYSIQNKNSSKFLYVKNYSISVGEYIVQHSYNGTYQDLWYIEKQAGGFYTISNMDSRLYLEVENGNFDNGAYIKQADVPSFGYRKWIIKQGNESGTYTRQSLASGKYMVVQNASTAENAYIIQYATGEDNKLWTLKKETFAPLPSTWSGLGGIYKIKNLYTNMFLVVKDASISLSEHLITWSTADTKNAWWSVVQKDNGTWLIKNLNSQLYMNVDGNSMEEGASIVQWVDGRDTGNSLWNIIPDPYLTSSNIFFLKNVRSGKYAHVQNDSETPGAWITQQYGDTPIGPNNKMRWEFIRVDSPSNRVLTKSISIDNPDDLISVPSQLKIYSIANNVFKISSNEKKIHQIQLMSVNGQILNQYNVGDIQYELNTDGKSTGVYLLYIIYDDKSSEARKILVK